MISVIISKETIDGKVIRIEDKNDVNHLKNSFRIKLGEKIRVVDGEFEYICEVVVIEKKIIEVEIIEKNEDRFSSKITVDAAIGILKNDKMDLSIQKLTEIGISKIIPLTTKRGVVKISEKKDKWDTIVREAVKQCQAVKLTEIDEVKKISDLDVESYDLVVVLYECEEEKSLRNILNKLEVLPKKILYIIGPEGGLEKEEVEYLENKGVTSVSLGKRILRAETASIIVGGILLNEF